MSKARRLLALFLSCLPHRSLRRVGYRWPMGYGIGRGCRIGFGVVIAVDRFRCDDGVRIGRFCRFVGPVDVVLGAGTVIGRGNRFHCGDIAAHLSQRHRHYRRSLVVGRNCLIHEDHLFDLYGTITIGDGSWIAGFGSQFLTHGAGVTDRDIAIGRDCYLGSAVRFAPGSAVGDRVIVGMGAVVSGRIGDSDAIVAGVPARKIRHRDADDSFEFSITW